MGENKALLRQSFLANFLGECRCVVNLFIKRVRKHDIQHFIPIEVIAQKIFLHRGQKVIFDFHLAELFGVEIKVLIQAVKRNLNRFPNDFMFQLNEEEFNVLRSQIVTSKKGRGGRRYLPFAFTEHGVAMLSSVLHSKSAIHINILIIRTFIESGKYLATQQQVKTTLREHNLLLEKHEKEIQSIVEVIRQLTILEEKPKRQIGFQIKEPRPHYIVKYKRLR